MSGSPVQGETFDLAIVTISPGPVAPGEWTLEVVRLGNQVLQQGGEPEPIVRAHRAG
jgi:hypothetical protein